MIKLYDKAYYHRLEKNSWIHKAFIGLANRKEPILSYLKTHKSQGSQLLDIGCGNGKFLYYVHNHFQCTGIDLSEAGIREAKQKAPKANVMVKNIYELRDFKTNHFDIITCFDVLEHILEIPKVLTEMCRILKPDGLLVISMPNFDCFSRNLKGRKWFGFDDKTHLQFYSPGEWGFLLKQSGFVPIKEYYNGLIDPPYLPFIPNVLQQLLLKYPTQALSILGFPIPKFLGEVMFMIAIKNPGWESASYALQKKMLQYK